MLNRWWQDESETGKIVSKREGGTAPTCISCMMIVNPNSKVFRRNNKRENGESKVTTTKRKVASTTTTTKTTTITITKSRRSPLFMCDTTVKKNSELGESEIPMKKGTGYTRTKENETVRLISPEDKTKEGSLFCFFFYRFESIHSPGSRTSHTNEKKETQNLETVLKEKRR